MILKQGTAYARKFLMVLASDHVTGATGKTVAVSISKGPAGAFAGAVGAVTELGNGVYQIALSSVSDVDTLGDLAFNCTATGCDPTTFIDQVQIQIFPDLALNTNGQALIGSNFKQNAAIPFFPFVMTANGAPTAGLTVTAQRNFGSGFSPLSGSVTDRGNGTYSISLSAADCNAASALYRFTANGADDRDITVFFQP